MKPDIITTEIHTFLNNQLTTLSANSPSIAFIKPIIDRIISKNLNKINYALGMIADDSGDIDVNTLLDEMITNLMNTKPFTIDTNTLGDVYIGEGVIKVNIPIIQKELVLNKEDLLEFKNILINSENGRIQP